MELISRRVYKKSIEVTFEDHFDLTREGEYLFEINASAKSWWQKATSGRIFSHKDSLTVTINSKAIFSTLKKRKLRADDLWNGNLLKGNDQTVYVVSRLQKGRADIVFSAYGTPFLNEVRVFLITDGKISLQKISPSQRNRIPWITLLLSDTVQANSFSLMARADRFRDDDEDLQLRIDEETQINEDRKAHRGWYWCGKALHGTSKTFIKDFIHGNKPVRFDILADGTPIIDSLALELTKEPDVVMGKIALYPDIEVAQEVNIRKDKNTLSPIIAKLKNGERIKILERLVVGEKIQNKSDIWHKVNYEGKIGYVLSSFVEIVGEERDNVIRIIKEQANKYAVDENLAIALAACESHYKPYAVSFTGALGIFQLTGIAREDLAKRDNFTIDENESFQVEKNIEGGIRYLKWVADSYRGVKDSDKKIVAAWNTGKSLIPIKGQIDLSRIPTAEKRIEVEKLIACVLKNKKKKDWRFIVPLCIGVLLLGAAGVLALEKKQVFFSEPKLYKKDVSLHFAFYRTPHDALSSILVYTVSEEPFSATSSIHYSIEGRKNRIDLRGFPVNAYFLGSEYANDFLFIAREEGHQIITSLLRYDLERHDLVLVPFIEIDGSISTELCCAFITHQPRKYGFGYDIVLYDYHKYTSLPPTKKIYKYDYSKAAYVAREE